MYNHVLTGTVPSTLEEMTVLEGQAYPDVHALLSRSLTLACDGDVFRRFISIYMYTIYVYCRHVTFVCMCTIYGMVIWILYIYSELFHWFTSSPSSFSTNSITVTSACNDKWNRISIFGIPAKCVRREEDLKWLGHSWNSAL